MATINLDIGGNTSRLDRDIQKAVNKVYNINLKTKGDQPLGRITGKVNEFNKSLDASNARVIAFGASAGIIFGLQKAFNSLVSSTIEVQKSLQDINVILNVSTTQLNKFGSELFNIAKTTGQSFDEVTKAATEFSRQGLGVAETLKRTSDALILSRLSGLDTVKSVEALTAAVNSFASQAVTATEIVNKFANVDAAFAVSSADLADAISRVGSSAAQSGVSLNELIALVTSAQQTTARGGAVIGNSFKTIFTRLQRGKVIDLLGSLGISDVTAGGEVKSTIQLLQELAKVYDTLEARQKASVAEQVGGVFQINILKAALADLGKEYSIYSSALSTAESSTDQAIKRNEQLNKTYAAQLNALQQNAKQLAANVGGRVLGPSFERIIGGANKILGGINESDGEDVGSILGKGILDGLGQILAGPGLVVIGGILLKLTKDFAKFGLDSGKSLLGLNSAAEQQKTIQQSITAILQKNPQLLELALKSEQGLNQAANTLFGSLQKQTLELEKQAQISTQIAKAFYGAGVRVVNNVPVAPSRKSGKATGYIPNFVGGISKRDGFAETIMAYQAGYEPGQVSKVDGKIYNKAESVVQFPGAKDRGIVPPKDSSAGKQYQKDFKKIAGYDPYEYMEKGNAKGFIPNFAKDKNKKLSGVNKKAVQDYIDKISSDVAYLIPAIDESGNRGKPQAVPPKEVNGFSFPAFPAFPPKNSQQTESLEKQVQNAVINASAEYTSQLQPLGKTASAEKIARNFKIIPGAIGALQGAIGSAFEVGISSALDYEAASRGSEFGDFDVRGGKELSQVQKLFGITASLADFKVSTKEDSAKSFRNKILNEAIAKTKNLPFTAQEAAVMVDSAANRKLKADLTDKEIDQYFKFDASKGRYTGLKTNVPQDIKDRFAAYQRETRENYPGQYPRSRKKASGYIPNFASPKFLGGIDFKDLPRATGKDLALRRKDINTNPNFKSQTIDAQILREYLSIIKKLGRSKQTEKLYRGVSVPGKDFKKLNKQSIFNLRAGRKDDYRYKDFTMLGTPGDDFEPTGIKDAIFDQVSQDFETDVNWRMMSTSKNKKVAQAFASPDEEQEGYKGAYGQITFPKKRIVDDKAYQLLLKKFPGKEFDIQRVLFRLSRTHGGKGIAFDSQMVRKYVENKGQLKREEDFPIYARGFIPNFAALQDAIGRERGAGVPSNRIYVAQDKRLAASGYNPFGLGVFNTRDEPTAGARSSAIKSRGYASGYIPNFVDDATSTPVGPTIGALITEFSVLSFALKDLKTDTQTAKDAIIQSSIEQVKADKLRLESLKKGTKEYNELNNSIRKTSTEIKRLKGGGFSGEALAQSVSSAMLIAAPIIGQTLKNAVGTGSQGARAVGAGIEGTSGALSFAGLASQLAPRKFKGKAAGITFAISSLLTLKDVFDQLGTTLPELSTISEEAAQKLTDFENVAQQTKTSFEQIKNLREQGQALEAGKLQTKLLTDIGTQVKDPTISARMGLAVENQDIQALIAAIDENTNTLKEEKQKTERKTIVETGIQDIKNQQLGFWEGVGNLFTSQAGIDKKQKRRKEKNLTSTENIFAEPLTNLKSKRGTERVTELQGLADLSQSSEGYVTALEKLGMDEEQIQKFVENEANIRPLLVQALNKRIKAEYDLLDNTELGNPIIKQIVESIKNIRSNYDKYSVAVQHGVKDQIQANVSIKNALGRIKVNALETQADLTASWTGESSAPTRQANTAAGLAKIDSDFTTNISEPVVEAMNSLEDLLTSSANVQFNEMATTGNKDQTAVVQTFENLQTNLGNLLNSFNIGSVEDLLGIKNLNLEDFQGFDVEKIIDKIEPKIQGDDAVKGLDNLREKLYQTNSILQEQKRIQQEQKILLAQQKFSEIAKLFISAAQTSFGGFEGFLNDSLGDAISKIEEAAINARIMGNNPQTAEGQIELGRQLGILTTELSKMAGMNIGPDLYKTAPEIIDKIQSGQAQYIESNLNDIFTGLKGLGPGVEEAFRRTLSTKFVGPDSTPLSNKEIAQKTAEAQTRAQYELVPGIAEAINSSAKAVFNKENDQNGLAKLLEDPASAFLDPSSTMNVALLTANQHLDNIESLLRNPPRQDSNQPTPKPETNNPPASNASKGGAAGGFFPTFANSKESIIPNFWNQYKKEKKDQSKYGYSGGKPVLLDKNNFNPLKDAIANPLQMALFGGMKSRSLGAASGYFPNFANPIKAIETTLEVLGQSAHTSHGAHSVLSGSENIYQGLDATRSGATGAANAYELGHKINSTKIGQNVLTKTTELASKALLPKALASTTPLLSKTGAVLKTAAGKAALPLDVLDVAVGAGKFAANPSKEASRIFDELDTNRQTDPFTWDRVKQVGGRIWTGISNQAQMLGTLGYMGYEAINKMDKENLDKIGGAASGYFPNFAKGRGKSPRGKSPRGKSPRGKSPRGKSPRGKSPRGGSPRGGKFGMKGLGLLGRGLGLGFSAMTGFDRFNEQLDQGVGKTRAIVNAVGEGLTTNTLLTTIPGVVRGAFTGVKQGAGGLLGKANVALAYAQMGWEGVQYFSNREQRMNEILGQLDYSTPTTFGEAMGKTYNNALVGLSNPAGMILSAAGLAGGQKFNPKQGMEVEPTYRREQKQPVPGITTKPRPDITLPRLGSPTLQPTIPSPLTPISPTPTGAPTKTPMGPEFPLKIRKAIAEKETQKQLSRLSLGATAEIKQYDKDYLYTGIKDLYGTTGYVSGSYIDFAKKNRYLNEQIKSTSDPRQARALTSQRDALKAKFMKSTPSQAEYRGQLGEGQGAQTLIQKAMAKGQTLGGKKLSERNLNGLLRVVTDKTGKVIGYSQYNPLAKGNPNMLLGGNGIMPADQMNMITGETTPVPKAMPVFKMGDATTELGTTIPNKIENLKKLDRTFKKEKAQSGMPKDQIYSLKLPELKKVNNPEGIGVFNTRDEKSIEEARKAVQRSQFTGGGGKFGGGGASGTWAGGYFPNFADTSPTSNTVNVSVDVNVLSSKNTSEVDKDALAAQVKELLEIEVPKLNALQSRVDRMGEVVARVQDQNPGMYNLPPKQPSK